MSKEISRIPDCGGAWAFFGLQKRRGQRIPAVLACAAVLFCGQGWATPVSAAMDSIAGRGVPISFSGDVGGANEKGLRLPGGVLLAANAAGPDAGASAATPRPGGTDEPAPMTLNWSTLGDVDTNDIPLRPVRMRVRIGDDHAWAHPDFNDSDWDETTTFSLPEGSTADIDGQPVWFRFPLRFAPELIGKRLVFQTKRHQYNLQFFLNGAPVAGAQHLDPTTGTTPRFTEALQTDNVVALRWVPNPFRPIRGPANIFTLCAYEYDRALTHLDRAATLQRRFAIHRSVLIAILALFFLFHFSLHRHHPSQRQSLWYCLTTLFCALALTALHVSELYNYDWYVWKFAYWRCFLLLHLCTIACGVGLFQVLLGGKLRRSFKWYAALALAAYVCSFWYGNDPVQFYPLLLLPEGAWMLWKRNKQRGWSIYRVFTELALLAIILFDSVSSMYGYESDSGFVRYCAWYCFVIMLQLVSLAIVRRYADGARRIEAFAEILEDEVRAKTMELNASHAHLEDQVKARTLELEEKSERLSQEILERELATKALSEISLRLYRAREEEGRRIAREMHDSVVQDLVAIDLVIGFAEDAVPDTNDVARQHLITALDLVRKSSQELRTMSYLLHPPLLDELGLIPMARSYLEGFSERSLIQVEVEMPPEADRLPAEIELTLYRVLQECLGNLHRYSGSATAFVRLEFQADLVSLEISDKGCGISPDKLALLQKHASAGGVGIAGMQERLRLLDGELLLQSGAGGTTVCARIPIGGAIHG
jgi:signal transduction histidine kinase